MTKNWVSIHVKKSTISAVEVRELRKSLEEAATTAEDQQRMIMDGLKDVLHSMQSDLTRSEIIRQFLYEFSFEIH
jgi:hypothetical protein